MLARYLDRTDVLRRINRPAWELPAHVIRIDVIPCLRGNELLVIFAWERRKLQSASKSVLLRPHYLMRSSVDNFTARCRDLW